MKETVYFLSSFTAQEQIGSFCPVSYFKLFVNIFTMLFYSINGDVLVGCNFFI